MTIFLLCGSFLFIGMAAVYGCRVDWHPIGFSLTFASGALWAMAFWRRK
jgi:hypothetical protein